MSEQQSAESLIGMQVRDTAGDKIGKIGQVWVNESTGRPAWASVRTGVFGSAESFIPLDGRCRVEQDLMRVPFERDMVKQSPHIDAQGDLAVSQQDELYRYYGMDQASHQAGGGMAEGDPAGSRRERHQDADRSASSADTTMAGRGASDTSAGSETAMAAGAGAGAGVAGGTMAGRSGVKDSPARPDTGSGRSGTPGKHDDTMAGRPGPVTSGSSARYDDTTATRPGAGATGSGSTTSGRSGKSSTSDKKDEAANTGMTRSEERLRVGTETVESGRVRMRKHVVTEHVTTTVPIRHEEIRIEREAIAEGSGMKGTISEADDTQEVVLHTERPIVETETVPVERVRINTEMVTEQRRVDGDVRKEQIDIDDDTGQQGTGQGGTESRPRHQR